MTEEQEKILTEFIEWLDCNYEIHEFAPMISNGVGNVSTFVLEDTSWLLHDFKRRNEPRVLKSIPLSTLTEEEFLAKFKK